MYNLDELFPRYENAGIELVKSAFEIAEKSLSGQTRSNGHPFIEHPLAVARIVCDEIGLGPECVAAVFLHEAMRFDAGADVSAFRYRDADGNEKAFGKDVQTMVEGLNKISTIRPKDTKLEAENYKKLIVSYSRDPRVVVLKLADRLEIMRELHMFPKLSRERKILETLMLYIPLAHQLGLYNMKSEMEDTYFRYAEPEMYRSITNKLKAGELEREKLMHEFVEPLKQQLLDEGIHYKVKIRTKTAWSIWKKMQKQKVPFEGVYDVFAMRFIIDCEDKKEVEHALCWKVFSLVTREYESDTKRLRDWISNPKPNGYESLHITVKNKQNTYLEVQIRTRRMDLTAESGLASHWSYKGIRQEATLDKWLNSVRYALEHPEDAGFYDDDDMPSPPSKEIFVFTPSGELRKLASGATVLDFAFDIHSNLGCRCTGGRVNGKAVRIGEKLKTGDVVEIMSNKNQKPSPDWLNIVVTSKARTKIKQKLSAEEFSKADEGKELLGRRLKNWKLELNDELLAAMLKKFQIKTNNAFYAAIGEGTVSVTEVKDFILELTGVKNEEPKPNPVQKPVETAGGFVGGNENRERSSDDILVIDAASMKNLDYKMSKCCNPVFGDDVFGFVTIKDGVKIHRISCPNAARLIEKYPYRIQRVKWASNPSTSSFQVTLRINAEKEPHVINEIMDVVNGFRASIRNFNVSENQRNGTYDINTRIAVPSNLELDKVISQIRNLSSVIRVLRG